MKFLTLQLIVKATTCNFGAQDKVKYWAYQQQKL